MTCLLPPVVGRAEDGARRGGGGLQTGRLRHNASPATKTGQADCLLMPKCLPSPVRKGFPGWAGELLHRERTAYPDTRHYSCGGRQWPELLGGRRLSWAA